MTLTLWRGNELLGELRLQSWQCETTANGPGRPMLFTALLAPAPGAPSCNGVVQTAIGGFVVQYGIQSGDVEQHGPRNAGNRPNSRAFALEPVPPEDLVGPENQLTVRDAAGRVYLPSWMRVEGWVEAMFTRAADGPGFAMAPQVRIESIVEGMQMQSDQADSYLHRPTDRA